MSGSFLSANDILDQLWSARERDLLQRIAADNTNLDYDILLSTYGNQSAQLGVKFDIHSGDSKVLDTDKKKGIRNNVPESDRCMARVWNGGKGGRCTRRGCKGPGSDLCGNHARCLEEKGLLPQGRMDEDIPENMVTIAKDVGDGGDLDVILKEMVNDDPLEIVEEYPGDLSSTSSGKKKRGRPKGRKNIKNDDLSSLEDEGDILEEEEIKSCVSQTDIQECLTNYLAGADWNAVTLSTAKKSIEKNLSIKSSDYDKKWFKSIFESKKSEMEEKIASSLKKEEEKQPDVEDSNSEEVSCQEITVGGKVYLLDPETMKVYGRESPNGFVGKYDGSKIDHDAEDSDAESDDED